MNAPDSSTGFEAVGEDLRLETITDGAAFAALGERWDELVRVMLRPSPFLLHGWLYEWWRHYGARGRLHVETAWRGERLVAAIPLFVNRRRGVRTAEFRVSKADYDQPEMQNIA